MNPIVTARLVPDTDRVQHTAKAFGSTFQRLEPAIFDMAGRLAAEYNGGYWLFYALSNGGFYMAPRSDTTFIVSSENGFEGELSADAFGIVCCLYSFSHLSFGGDAFADLCANQYHLVREYMFQHPEVRSILRAID